MAITKVGLCQLDGIQITEHKKCAACEILVGPGHLEVQLTYGTYESKRDAGSDTRAFRLVQRKPITGGICDSCLGVYQGRGFLMSSFV